MSDAENPIEVVDIYGADEAHQVIAASMEDYTAKFPQGDRRKG